MPRGSTIDFDTPIQMERRRTDHSELVSMFPDRNQNEEAFRIGTEL
jgi:hypothetical protein